MTAAKPKHQLQKVGRKSEFKSEYCAVVKGMSRMGATSADLARELGVSIFSIYSWRSKYPEFAEAIKIGKDGFDDRTERSLYERANGGSWPATKVLSDGRVIEYIEHYPPDTVAALFWLKNRRPDKWRDVQRLEAELGHYVISERPLSIEEWIKDHTDTKQIDGVADPVLTGPKQEDK